MQAVSLHRYEEIDSLRGLAALFVVMYHALLLWNAPVSPWFHAALISPLGLCFAGSKSVYLFFVMSGFVLFLPYQHRQSRPSYKVYVTKRICRIYLPYLAALGVAVLADLLFARQVPGFFEQLTWTRPFPKTVLVQHVLFLGVYPPHQFNFAFWSLVQELRVSLLYPVVAYIALRLELGWSILLGCFLVAFGTTADVHFYHWFWLTLSCFGMFLIGASIARHLEYIQSWVQRRHGIARCLMFVAVLIPLWLVDVAPLTLRRQTWLFPCHVLGVSLVLVLALTTGRFKAFLHFGCMRWLGKTSYSLYLLHGTILYALYNLFWQRYDHVTVLTIGVVTAIVLSGPFYRWVEVPSIAMGKLLTRRAAKEFRNPAV